MNVCHNCNNKYKSIGIHWNKSSSCDHPQLSDYQKELLIGGLMSDATLSTTDSNRSGRPSFKIYNTNRGFLEWYKNKLGVIAKDVTLYESGEEKHKRNIEYGFDEERDANYKDIYRLSTVSHPFNEKLYQWYSSGEKLYPKDLTLTPTMAKVWYAGDGNINWDKQKRGYCEIGCNNESEYKDKIISLFVNAGFKVSFSNGRVRLYGESKDFLNWLGEPPNGMEYKWEIEDRKKYDELRKV